VDVLAVVLRVLRVLRGEWPSDSVLVDSGTWTSPAAVRPGSRGSGSKTRGSGEVGLCVDEDVLLGLRRNGPGERDAFFHLGAGATSPLCVGVDPPSAAVVPSNIRLCGGPSSSLESAIMCEGRMGATCDDEPEELTAALVAGRVGAAGLDFPLALGRGFPGVGVGDVGGERRAEPELRPRAMAAPSRGALEAAADAERCIEADADGLPLSYCSSRNSTADGDSGTYAAPLPSLSSSSVSPSSSRSLAACDAVTLAYGLSRFRSEFVGGDGMPSVCAWRGDGSRVVECGVVRKRRLRWMDSVMKRLQLIECIYAGLVIVGWFNRVRHDCGGDPALGDDAGYRDKSPTGDSSVIDNQRPCSCYQQ